MMRPDVATVSDSPANGQGVTVTVDSVSGVDTNLQQITVAVAYKGATVVTAESYKVNR